MKTTMFVPGTALIVGDVVHPAESEPVIVAAIHVDGSRAQVLLKGDLYCRIELTADDVVEIEERAS